MSTQNEKEGNKYPGIISYDCNKKIVEQMEKCICKIKINNKQGTGFFCKIPFPDKNKILPVLITNNHILDENELSENNVEMQLFIKAEEDIKRINLNKRMKYTNEEYDISIIEIKEKDDIKNYIDLDDNIANDINNVNINRDFKHKLLYILQYPNGQLSLSFGILSDIYEDKKNEFNFNHKCSTEYGSSGAPILNLDNNKIIGIHKEGNKPNNYNIGTFINYPIKDFIQKYYYNKDNSEILKYLIKNLFLKKELSSLKKSLKFVNGFLINRAIIQKLNEYYNINETIHFLNNNYLLKGANYQNFNSIYTKINNYLNIHQNNYTRNIEKEKIKFSQQDKEFNIKYINKNNNLAYIDNFELIDEEFALFLSKTYNNEINILPTNLIFNENKFIFSIKLINNYIYEITSLYEKDVLKCEYTIEILNNNNIYYDIKLLNNYFFKIIYEKGINKLISCRNPMIIDNTELIFQFHSIKEGIIIIQMDGLRYEISFDFDRNIEELRKYFFYFIKKPELIENKNIIFTKNNNSFIPPICKISKYFEEKENSNLIFVIDLINFKKMRAIKRLKEELSEIINNPITNCGTTVGLYDKDNIFHWKATISGAKDTSYKDGKFKLDIKFPYDYPDQPPEISFKTPIYHINVNPCKPKLPGDPPLGLISIPSLNLWKHEYLMREVLTNIFALFYIENPECPFEFGRGYDLKYNKSLHEEKIKYFTKKYATSVELDLEKISEHSWDFTYPC